MVVNMKPTPNCPRGLFEFACSVEDVDLVCFLEYSPEEKGSTDSYGSPYEPDIEECMTLNNAYIAGTDVDIAHMILQSQTRHTNGRGGHKNAIRKGISLDPCLHHTWKREGKSTQQNGHGKGKDHDAR